MDTRDIGDALLEAAREADSLYSFDGITGDVHTSLDNICSLASLSATRALNRGDEQGLVDSISTAMIAAFQMGRKVERGEYNQ